MRGGLHLAPLYASSASETQDTAGGSEHGRKPAAANGHHGAASSSEAVHPISMAAVAPATCIPPNFTPTRLAVILRSVQSDIMYVVVVFVEVDEQAECNLTLWFLCCVCN